MQVEARIRRLENRISHWETQLEQQRAHINGTADKKIEASKTDAQREYWEEYRRSALAAAQLRENVNLEPMREELRRLIGLTDEEPSTDE